MTKRIRVLRGTYAKKNRISDCVFPLVKPLEFDKGKIIAQVDASQLLGAEFKKLTIDVEDYKLLD
jgi:hypothetical protein